MFWKPIILLSASIWQQLGLTVFNMYFFLPAHGLQTHLQIMILFVLKNITTTYRHQELFLLDAKNNIFRFFRLIALRSFIEKISKKNNSSKQGYGGRMFCCINYVYLVTINGFSQWARTLERGISYQNEGQILTLIFNNIYSSISLCCMITMPNE